MKDIHYGSEKLTTAAFFLVEKGPIKDRLFKAFLEFHTISKDNLIDAQWEEFIDIYSRLTAVTATGEEGALNATLSQMTEDEMEEIAQKILELSFLAHGESLIGYD